MKKHISIIIIAVFVLMATSSAINGGVVIYSGAGQHQTGEFIPASDSEITVLSKPQEQPKTVKKNQEKNTIIKNTTIIVKPNSNLQRNTTLIYKKRRRPNYKLNKPIHLPAASGRGVRPKASQ